MNVLLKCKTLKANAALISLCWYYLNVNIILFPLASLTFQPHICLSVYLIWQITVWPNNSCPYWLEKSFYSFTNLPELWLNPHERNISIRVKVSLINLKFIFGRKCLHKVSGLDVFTEKRVNGYLNSITVLWISVFKEGILRWTDIL